MDFDKNFIGADLNLSPGELVTERREGRGRAGPREGANPVASKMAFCDLDSTRAGLRPYGSRQNNIGPCNIYLDGDFSMDVEPISNPQKRADGT